MRELDRPTPERRDEKRAQALLYPARTVQATPIDPPVNKVRPRDVTPRAQTTTPRRST